MRNSRLREISLFEKPLRGSGMTGHDSPKKTQMENTKNLVHLNFWVVVSNFFCFHPYLGEMMKIWGAYFSNGLVSTTSAIGLDIYFPYVVSCNYVTLKRHVQLTRTLSLQRDWVSISPIESMSCSEIKLVIWWLVAGCLFFFSCLIYPILPWFQCNKCNPELAEAGNPWSWGHVVALRARVFVVFR